MIFSGSPKSITLVLGTVQIQPTCECLDLKIHDVYLNASDEKMLEPGK